MTGGGASGAHRRYNRRMRKSAVERKKHSLSLSDEAWTDLEFIADDLERSVSWVVERLAVMAKKRVENRLQLVVESDYKSDLIDSYHETLEELGLR